MQRFGLSFSAAIACAAGIAASAANADTSLLFVRSAPSDGLVIAHVAPGLVASGVVHAKYADGREVPSQFIPDQDAGTIKKSPSGTLALRLPGAGDYRLTLISEPGTHPAPSSAETTIDTEKVVQFSLSGKGGLPASFRFTRSGKLFDNFVWNDRLWDPKIGGFLLRNDPHASAAIISSGPICTVIRAHARYCGDGGRLAPSRPEATYTWLLFKNSPLIFLSAHIHQAAPFNWPELHLLELNFPGLDFVSFAGGNPAVNKPLTGIKQSADLSSWGAIVKGPDAIGMFGNSSGGIRVYDGRGEYGTYLHSTWKTFGDTDEELATWLWVGTSGSDPAKAVETAAGGSGARGEIVVTTGSLHARISAQRSKGGEWAWRAAIASRLEAGGNLSGANALLGLTPPANWTFARSGDCGIGLQRSASGIVVQSLFDLKQGRELLAPGSPPLFAAGLRSLKDHSDLSVNSTEGWKSCTVSLEESSRERDASKPNGTGVKRNISLSPLGSFRLTHQQDDARQRTWESVGANNASYLSHGPEASISSSPPARAQRGTSNMNAVRVPGRVEEGKGERGYPEVPPSLGEILVLRWSAPNDPRLKGVSAEAIAAPDQSGWSWSFHLNVPAEYGVTHTTFPQIAISKPDVGAYSLFPAGPGVVNKTLWNSAYSMKSVYPTGWCAMQFEAICPQNSQDAGLYFGMHDPFGGVKEIGIVSDPASQSVRLSYDMPAPNPGKSANGFRLSGTAVWRLLRGDWYDAAMVYRDWVAHSAKWWPKLTDDGRADTPLWMRELCGWALSSGPPDACVPGVLQMQKQLGVPMGFHWYEWHSNPFDNDYPHYFPTKPGVAEAVGKLQQSNVFVMPYINGRLWDTRDRGTEDFEFTKLARPSAAKDETGQPITESYGSKENDGTPVKLAVMCPTTELWQRTVRETVLRIMNEVGTKGVYIDQIAAAGPVLCMDPTHGHPLGGGHWWTEEGYWKLLAALRDAMPQDRMITTECNAEPYIRFMDGYLTWHWQWDSMVPAFPAIYAGAIQMFSRAYNGTGPTRNDAFCMRMGQQLVFGEQIGWLNPNIAAEEVAGPMLQQTVQLRHQLRRFFYAGRMQRPLKLTGAMPTVRADWQWGGEDWVTTDAVMTGVWKLEKEKKLAVVFTNVSDKPVSLTVHFNGAQYGITAKDMRLRERSKATFINSDERLATISSHYTRTVTFAPRSATAWEISW